MTDFTASASTLTDEPEVFFSSGSWTSTRSVPRMSLRPRRYKVAADASASKEITPLEIQNVDDVAILNRAQAQVFEIHTERAKRRLIALLGRFHDEGYSSVAARENKISKQSWEVAVEFIRLLPFGVTLPQILPDSEGGVIFAWANNDRKFFLTIENYTLHAVDRAGTPNAAYLDNVKFRGDKIPAEILAAMTI